MADDYPKQRLVLAYIQAIGVFLVPIAILVNWHSIDVQAQWNRRRITFDLLARYTNELKDHVKIVEVAYPGLRDPTKGEAPSPEEAQILATSQEGTLLPDGKSKAVDVRRHLNAVFNYFEDVAVAWEYETCDRDIVEQEAAPGVVRWADFFANYIQAEDAMSEEPNWPPLIQVVKIWKSKGHGRLSILSAAAPSSGSTPAPRSDAGQKIVLDVTAGTQIAPKIILEHLTPCRLLLDVGRFSDVRSTFGIAFAECRQPRKADMNTYLVTLTVDDDSHSVYVTADNAESAFAEAVKLYPLSHVQPHVVQLVGEAS